MGIRKSTAQALADLYAEKAEIDPDNDLLVLDESGLNEAEFLHDVYQAEMQRKLDNEIASLLIASGSPIGAWLRVKIDESDKGSN